MLEIDYETNVDIGYREITAALPHRHPFLLLDKVVYVDVEDDTIVAKKNVTANEDFFQGHFPEAPIMPGVLILEALAQTGAFLFHHKGYVPENKIAVLLSIDKAKFRQAVHPGDTLTLYGKALHYSGNGGKLQGKAMVNGKVACQAEIGFAMVPKAQV